MAFKINNQTVADNYGVIAPSYAANSRPSSPVTGQVIFNTDRNVLEIYDNGLWKDIDNTSRGNSFLYRTVITTSYVHGGYVSTSPWRNVNRMTHATDLTYNLGDLLTNAGAYTSGACNLTRAFQWASDNTWPGTSTITSAFNMNTETAAGLNSNWNMYASRDDCGTIFKEHYYAYICGGGNTKIDVFNLTTETMYSTWQGATSDAYNAADNGGCSAISDETKGFVYGGTPHRLTFSTTQLYTLSTTGHSVGGSHGQQKGINSKLGRGYAGNEGSYNGGYNFRRFNLVTEASSGAVVSKPVGNSGEENFDMGQNWQYMMGCYDGSQNNRGHKFNYLNETGYELGAGSTRTGVPGGSSGHCAWRG